MPPRPTLLVDGNNLLIRGVEATRHSAKMTSPDGTDTSALVIFIRTLSQHIRAEKPFRVVVCWDAGYDMRTALYPPYKANRPTTPDPYRSGSRRLAEQFLELARVPQARIKGVEADDLIASYWRAATAPVTILSNDKDMLMLVGDTPTGHRCEQIRPSSGGADTDRWDEARVNEYFGCTPAQLPLVMSLTGDGSDNIPGVPGIGPKFSIKHLSAANWDLDAVTHKAIAEHRDNGNVAIYRQLVDLRDGLQVPVPTLCPFMPVTPGPDLHWDGLYHFLTTHGLRRVTNQLANGELW